MTAEAMTAPGDDLGTAVTAGCASSVGRGRAGLAPCAALSPGPPRPWGRHSATGFAVLSRLPHTQARALSPRPGRRWPDLGPRRRGETALGRHVPETRTPWGSRAGQGRAAQGAGAAGARHGFGRTQCRLGGSGPWLTTRGLLPCEREVPAPKAPTIPKVTSSL